MTSLPNEYEDLIELGIKGEAFVDEELSGVEEELSPELTQALYRLAKKAVAKLEEAVVNPIAMHRSEVKRVLNASRISDVQKHDFASVLAVDSTWSSPPLELVWGCMTVIVVGYVVATPEHGFHGISGVALGLFPEGASSRSVELRSKVLEYSTAIRALERYEGIVEAVLIDGPLLPGFQSRFCYTPAESSDVVRESRSVRGPRLASYSSRALIDLARECRSRGVPLVGVVKRVGSRFLAPILREKGLEDVAKAVELSNDKALMSLVLEPGEYVVLGSLLDIVRKYLEYVGRSKALRALDEACSGEASEVAKELCEVLKDTSVVFYRAPRDSVHPQATRLDVYPSTEVDRVLRFAMVESSQNSVPIPIDLVDRFVRLESVSIKRFHEMLMAHAEKFETLSLLGFTNPQKSYLIRRQT